MRVSCSASRGGRVRFGTVCSGIETVSIAMPHWEPRWFSEIDGFCCALLAEKYPQVRNYGDITRAEIKQFAAVDVAISGTPCQSFSVQGKRGGVDDARGQLAIKFAELVGEVRPRWVVWENVPGVLTSNGGRDFGLFLRQLGQLGYGFAYRVLDARHFGVAQRRRRVFVVAHDREDWQRPAAVLFDSPQSRTVETEDSEVPQEPKQRTDAVCVRCVGWTGDETPKFGYDIVPTLKASQGGEGVGVAYGNVVRRLTVAEWERLQGIEDGYTDIKGWSVSHRKKAIGNAFCVNVIRWILERVEHVHRY